MCMVSIIGHNIVPLYYEFSCMHWGYAIRFKSQHDLYMHYCMEAVGLMQRGFLDILSHYLVHGMS